MPDQPTDRSSLATNRPLPIILVRGFGGLGVEDEKRLTHQGFNVGTVYHQKRGENYIYEGMLLRLLKSPWRYRDATNVVGFFGKEIKDHLPLDAEEFRVLGQACFAGDKIVLDVASARQHIRECTEHSKNDGWPITNTVWIYRYYDLDERNFDKYGRGLVRFIDLVQALYEEMGLPTKVNLIAHSMGGLIVREAVQITYPVQGRAAADHINKIVTLGTPHKGISFQVFSQLGWLPLEASAELERFSPERQADAREPLSFAHFAEHFPTERLLTVVGTSYRSYEVWAARAMNRLFSVSGEFGPAYNRSDGLVKINNAELDGCPRTYVHKCHGGNDSLVTARESYEIAMRFFHGNVRARLRFIDGKVSRGQDWFGKSEFFMGVCIKPRFVDFELFHQSRDAENCYGPFNKTDFSDKHPTFGWADDNRLIWEGFLSANIDPASQSQRSQDMVFRADFYIAERDIYGVGFSDNVVLYKQYYVRAILRAGRLELWRYAGEQFADGGDPAEVPDTERMAFSEGGWLFDVKGTGFEGRYRIELDWIPESGEPQPLGPDLGAGASGS